MNRERQKENTKMYTEYLRKTEAPSVFITYSLGRSIANHIDSQEQTIEELRAENASLLVIATDKQAEIESLKCCGKERKIKE